jgi:hypothetical protein
MSIALDFSDMFRQAPREQSESTVKPTAGSPECAIGSNDENAAPTAAADMKSWVQSTLRSLNLTVKDEDLPSGSLSVWQRLLTERLQWQNQSQSVVEENIVLRRKFENLDREKTGMKTQIDGLLQVIILLFSLIILQCPH